MCVCVLVDSVCVCVGVCAHVCGWVDGYGCVGVDGCGCVCAWMGGCGCAYVVCVFACVCVSIICFHPYSMYLILSNCSK